MIRDLAQLQRNLPDPDFWAGRRVLLTGHTGFKGGWTALWLAAMGARVTGFAREPDTSPALYELAQVDRDITSIIGDLRDVDAISGAVERTDPEIALHMAAQPLVRRAIAAPAETFAINVLGTAHLLDALLGCRRLKAVLVITSDKVYANDGCGRPLVESDALGGKDPYSASKAATELLTLSYANSLFDPVAIPCATARAGNIIGGGDFAPDRLVPDVMRAVAAGVKVVLRHPEATRPWQHVLDCVAGYLLYAEALAAGCKVPRALNFGPRGGEAMTVAELAEEVLKFLGQKPEWNYAPEPGSLEMRTLALDASVARNVLGWQDQLAGSRGIAWTAEWYRAHSGGADMRQVSLDQIATYSRLHVRQ